MSNYLTPNILVNVLTQMIMDNPSLGDKEICVGFDPETTIKIKAIASAVSNGQADRVIIAVYTIEDENKEDPEAIHNPDGTVNEKHPSFKASS